jgi:hypothetical protein
MRKNAFSHADILHYLRQSGSNNAISESTADHSWSSRRRMAAVRRAKKPFFRVWSRAEKPRSVFQRRLNKDTLREAGGLLGLAVSKTASLALIVKIINLQPDSYAANNHSDHPYKTVSTPYQPWLDE